MKFLYCKACYDIFRLWEEERTCKCGKTKGRYLDLLAAEYVGDFAVPLGVDNFSFVRAVRRQPEKGRGEQFEAFVIPERCPTFKRKGTPGEGWDGGVKGSTPAVTGGAGSIPVRP